ncbi:hypothetical protein J2T55_000193 [Methylohalomonas lacus]|uniref:Uncharacterized protein n=1 Tax=Methylohalomonas lacus TaxID=398773 RepID=A0AAE3L0V0_9GAMM|nr:hypothetical protein [Methylohalomonas lacus]
MTLAERVVEFLNSRRPSAFCDDCIADEMGSNRHHTQQTTHPLGLTRGYERARNHCHRCGADNKLAIRGL